MAQSAPGLPSELERLNRRVDELERRLSALETHSSPAPALATPVQSQVPLPTAIEPLTSRITAVPAIGKAVLGLAGAFLLRAIAESNSFPRLAIVLIGIFYAAAWLVLAVRNHATSRVASVAYGVTSLCILAPLLWECTIRFQSISPSFSAITLAAFFTFTVILSWRARLQVLPAIATSVTIITAWALIIATHDLVPLTAALLAIAFVTEVAACFGYLLGTRIPTALSADLGICLLLAIMTSGAVPESYSPVAPATIELLSLGLLLIYSASIALHGFRARLPISWFEVVQAVPAFTLAATGILRASHGSLSPALGAIFLVLSGISYWGTLSRFNDDSCRRNRRLAASWAAALLVAGSLFLLPPTLCVPLLCLASILAAYLYARSSKTSLGMHATVYLVAAAALSQLPNYSASALVGTVPAFPHWSVFVISAASFAAYIIGSRTPESRAIRRLLWTLPAAIVAFSIAACAIAAFNGLASGHLLLTPSRLSVVRTVITCLLALALAFAGAQWKRIELCWVAFAVTIFGTLKLLFEDLRFGNPASLVISLLSYGLVLIIVPRLTRKALDAS